MQRLHGCRGQTLPLVVLFMLSLLGIAGATIDVASWYQSKQSLQAAADAAALAGASQLPSSWGTAQVAASSEFEKNSRQGDSATYANTSDLTGNDSVTVSTPPVSARM